MKKLLLFAVLATPAFSQFFGGSNASKIRGINVLGPLTVSDGCALVYVAASTRFECGAGSGGGTGNGIVAVTVSAATSATLTHNAVLATPYIVPFVCREDTTNLPVIPATTAFSTNAIDFTFSPAFTGKCAASTGGSGISGSIATSQICYGSASNTCAGSAGLTFSDSANVRLATLAGGSSQSTNALLDITNSAGSSHWLTVLGDGKVGVGTNAPSVPLQINSAASNPAFWLTGGTVTQPFTGIGFVPEVTARTTSAFVQANTTYGGLQINAFTANGSTTTTGIAMAGYIGSNTPAADAPAITLTGWKSDGGTSRTAMTGSNLVLQIKSGDTPLISVLGGGSTGIGKSNISSAAATTLSVLDATASTGATATWIGHDGSATYSGVHLSALTTSLKVVAGLTQSTTPLQEWTNASGVTFASVSSSGHFVTSAGVYDANVNWGIFTTGMTMKNSYLLSWSSTGVYSGTNDTSLSRIAAKGIGLGSGAAASVDGYAQAAGYMANGGTKFTASGCSNSTTVGGATAGKFSSGTSGACTVVITMNGATGLTAPTGWACSASDLTTPANLISQSASSTTTATLTGTTVSGDVISFSCIGY